MRRTKSAASWRGITAAVTYMGREELSPRATGTAWGGHTEGCLGYADDRYPELGIRPGAQAGREPSAHHDPAA
jgi:hypothetical protein